MAGRKGDLSGQQVALFRDPETVAALQRADAEVQQLFLRAGFGLTSWHSDLPAGQYRPRDAAGRAAVLTRLGDALQESRWVLRGSDWGGFDLAAFLDGQHAAVPLSPAGGADPDAEPEPEAVPLPRATRRPRPVPGTPARRNPVLQVGRTMTPLQRACALGVLVVSYLLILAIWHVVETVETGQGRDIARAAQQADPSRRD